MSAGCTTSPHSNSMQRFYFRFVLELRFYLPICDGAICSVYGKTTHISIGEKLYAVIDWQQHPFPNAVKHSEHFRKTCVGSKLEYLCHAHYPCGHASNTTCRQLVVHAKSIYCFLFISTLLAMEKNKDFLFINERFVCSHMLNSVSAFEHTQTRFAL